MVKIIVPTEIEIETLPEISKIANGQKFVRRGANRRQNHGSRGNGRRPDKNDSWFSSREDDAIEARKREIVLHGGLVEME